jgi:predicted ATPase
MADWLARLVDKSLALAVDGPAGSQWYRQLETIRQFGEQRLRDSGEEGGVRARHLRFYVALAEAADQTVRWANDLP